MPNERLIKLINAMKENAWVLVKHNESVYGNDAAETRGEVERWLVLCQIADILTDNEYAEDLWKIFCKEEVTENA